MKRIFMVFIVLLTSSLSKAQVKTPQPSPHAIVSQTVGLTEVVIDYSRPSAKGRIIFGDLVPFGKLWRTGANANSTVSFSEDVVINGTTVKSGKYAIFVTPKAEIWEVVLYTDTDNWGIPENWDANKVAILANVDAIFLSKAIESLTISIGNLTNESATLDIGWEKTMVSLKFEVPTKKMAMASIEKTLAGPTAADYYSSAMYFLQSNSDITKALDYINKAIDLIEDGKDIPFWYLRQKSLIQAKSGDKSAAIETARLSLAAAEKAKNNDYIKMNNDSIKEWSKK